jgi:hypothetical protein
VENDWQQNVAQPSFKREAPGVEVTTVVAGHSDAFDDKLTALWAGGTTQGWRWPSLPSFDKINKDIQDQIDAIMRQEIGPKAGLAQAQREAQALLDQDIRLMN